MTSISTNTNTNTNMPPSKRHRLDPDSVKEGAVASTVLLPNEVLLRIVSFSDPSARLKMAHTCTTFWKAVEEHEKRVYNEIKRFHRVDETFDARVGDQTNLSTAITGRTKPVVLPFRYRKIVAMKTSLYCITMDPVEHAHMSPEMIISPSEDRIAVKFSRRMMGDAAYVYDLSTRGFAGTCLPRQRRVTFMEEFLLIDDERIIAFDNPEGFYVWNISETGGDRDGRWHLPEEEGDWIVDWTRNGQEEILAVTLFFDDALDRYARLNLLSININERSLVQRIDLGEAEGLLSDVDHVSIVGLSSSNKWLLLHVHARQQSTSIHLAVNLETKQTTRRFLTQTEDSNHWVQQMSYCSRTFYSIRNGRHFVFDLGDDGLLTERSSFLVEGEWSFKEADYQSVRSAAVRKRRKELLILGTADEIVHRIEAFCLEEPFVM